jgi:apolipoprotein N-acyltransferase
MRACAALVAAWISLALLGLPLARALRPEPRGPTHELLILQPDLPRGERWGDDLQALNLRRVRSFLERSAHRDLTGISAIVLPENLLTTPVDAAPELLAQLEQWVDHLGVPVVTGLAMAPHAPEPDLYRGAVVWIEPGRGITARIDKVRAVPVLESSRKLPGESLLAPLFGEAAGWRKVEEAADAGPLRGGVTLTPVLCYEALFPRLVARRRSPDSVAIVNLADDGWVAGDAATRQLTAFASFRAIEQRLTLIRVAHGGLSVVVDPFGHQIEALPLDTYATTRVTVRAMPPPTLHEKIAIVALPAGTGLGVWWIVGILFTLDRRHRE